MKPRDYQTQAEQAIRRAFVSHQSVLVVLATGLGKTALACWLAERALGKGRILWLAHTRELVHQAAERLQAITGQDHAIEMADQKVNEDSVFHRTPIVVASIQTMARRYKKFSPDEFSLVVVDEAHHAVSPSWRRVINYFLLSKTTYILGLTATPDRADEQALGKVFDHCAFSYDIRDGINNGYLAPIRQTQVTCKALDFSKVRSNKGDLDEAQLAKVIEQEQALHQIASPLAELTKGRRTVVFTLRVAQAKALAALLNRYHKAEVSCVVDGKMSTDDRKQTLKQFTAGEYQYCLNVGVLTEGWDDPGVEVIAMARPTKSRALYTQCIGRGTRTLPGVIDGLDTAEQRHAAIAASDKPSVEVIDFTGNAGKHHLICTADILGGDYDDEVVEATRKAMQDERDLDVMELLDRMDEEAAKRKAAEEQRILDEYAMEQAYRNRYLDGVVAEADYYTQAQDAFGHKQMTMQAEPVATMFVPATERQVSFLVKNGVKDAASMSKREAGKLVGELKERFQQGLCTHKQRKLLNRYGYDGDRMSMDEARKKIDLLAANGWKRVSE